MRIATRFVGLVCVALALAACGGGGTKPSSLPTTPGAATAAPSATAPLTAGPTSIGPATSSEAGENPIFWRTANAFSSLVSGHPYLVVFRITNGYAEPTLDISAMPKGSDNGVAFEAQQVQPGPGEAPGEYYAVYITLDKPGPWELTITAEEDVANIPIEAARDESE